MKILLTGSSGFIGRNYLLRSKFKNEFTTCIYFQSQTFPAWLEKHNNNHIVHKIDLTNRLDVETVLQKDQEYDVCLYLAANGDPAFSYRFALEDLYKNTVSVINICNFIKAKKFIYFSSGAVYDGISGFVNPKVKLKPKLPYAISKLASEYYLGYFKSIGRLGKVSIVRFFGAYGPYEAERKIYGNLVRQFGLKKESSYVIKGDGKNLIDAMYIGDTIAAIDNLIEDPLPLECFDLTLGDPQTITQLVNQSAKVFNINPNIFYEGTVPEYIKFISNDTLFTKRYGKVGRTTLEEGLRLYYKFITDENNYSSFV